MSNNKVIKITVKDGMVEIIDDIPEGIIVMILDYDIEGSDENRLTKDSEGKCCIVSIYDSTANKYKQF
jgi:hypothetical protein